MSHREDLLAGAVRCLRERGYAHTTARDIVAASGTNLASIGYHYGSTKALLNAAVLAAMDDFGGEMARAIGEPDPGQSALERFEQFWTRVIDSFRTSSQVWLSVTTAATLYSGPAAQLGLQPSSSYVPVPTALLADQVGHVILSKIAVESPDSTQPDLQVGRYSIRPRMSWPSAR